MKTIKTLRKKFRKSLTALFPGLETATESFRRTEMTLLSSEEIFANGEVTFASEEEYDNRIETLLDRRELYRGS